MTAGEARRGIAPSRQPSALVVGGPQPGSNQERGAELCLKARSRMDALIQHRSVRAVSSGCTEWPRTLV